MDPDNTLRELYKIHDTIVMAAEHFQAESRMNAALHMSRDVHPAPLASAMLIARDGIDRLIMDFEKHGAASPTGQPHRGNEHEVKAQ